MPGQPAKFVANDVVMHYENSRCLLITGPNMGGKSTLLRATCLVVIMAQIGCYVPAESCEFTVVDQIFTRIGASDRILENKSTFFLELEETKYLLDNSTPHSLIIMDELGRGTSTFDGYAVLMYLNANIRPRVLFTTHYHWLVDDFKNTKGVRLYKMSIRNDGEGIIFEYRFVEGVSHLSFGVNVARMAGLSKHVIDKAKEVSKDFSKRIERIKNSCETVVK